MTASLDGYVEGLKTLLLQTCEPSTERIQAATAALNQNYYKHPACVGALVEIIATAQEVSIRQLAAVELRKRVTKHWKKVRQQEKLAVKNKLLELVLSESVRRVRHAISQTVSVIAELEFRAQSWGELLQFVYQACRADQPEHREIGFYLLLTLYETIAAGLEQHMDFLFQIFAGGLQDPVSLEVRYTSVSILGKVAEYMEPADKSNIQSFQNLLPAMVTVLSQCLESQNEEGAKKCYEVFETLLILDVPLINKHMKELVDFFLRTAGNQAFPSDSRIQALSFIMWATKYKASKFSALKLISPVIEALLPIGAEDDPDEEEDEDDDTVSRVACRVIDMLATSLPPQQFFPPLMEQVTRHCGSPNAGHRKAGMMALAVSLEGCSDFVAPQFDQCLEFISRSLQDPEAKVRRAACIALSCLAEELSEEVASRHSTLLPIILPLIDLSENTYSKQAIIALDAILEGLGKEILPYLHNLMERLIPMLDQAPMKLKPALIATIGSCAHASKMEFHPYFGETFQRLLTCMKFTQKDQEYVDCKGVAIDTIGTLAEAVGKETFAVHAQEVIPLAFAGLDDENAKLRECSFVFFAVMTRIYEEDFAQFLPRLMPVLLTALKQQEDVESLYEDADLSTNAKAEDDEAIRDEADEMAKVASAIAFEKEVAADSIGEIFTHTKSQFLPYLEESVKAVQELLDHYYEGARKSASTVLLKSIKVFYEIQSSERWTAGLSDVTPLPADVAALATRVMPQILEHLLTDDDKGVVYGILTDLADTMNTCGPSFLSPYFDSIGRAVIEILQKKAFCQRIDEGDEAELDEDEVAQADSDLIAGAGEVIGSIALVSGSEGVQALRMFLPHLVKYYKKERSKTERSTVIGTCSDVTVGLGAAIEEFTPSLLQLNLQGLEDDDFDVRSNAAFGLGLLVEHAPQDLSSRYLEFLSALQPLFAPGINQTAQDNAVGAVSRLILRNLSAVPLDQVLPVLLQACPLKRDFRENQPLVKAMILLLEMNNPLLVQDKSSMLKFFEILQSALDEDPQNNLDEETLEKIGQVKMALQDRPEFQ